MPLPAPKRIWAFHAPHLADSEDGATVIAYEEWQMGSHEYVRADVVADALIEAERRGAEWMREQTAAYVSQNSLSWRFSVPWAGKTFAEEIRALPLTKETPDA